MSENKAPDRARFLLIAPLQRDSNAAPVAPVSPKERVHMWSRIEFETGILTQVWTSLAPTSQGNIDLPKSAISQAAGWTVYVADAYMALNGREIHEIEAELTRAVESVCARELGRTPLWVSRTAVGLIPDKWLDTYVAEVPTGIEGQAMRLGWGNNFVPEDLLQDFPTWENAVRGLVDAQILWCCLYAVSTETGAVLREIALAPALESKVSAGAIATASSMIRALVLYDLARDELTTQLQGIRKLCAIEHLELWGAAELREQSGRRVEDLRTLAQEAITNRSRRYQSLVEGILFALALTAVLQTALALAQTAYGGGVSEVPGGNAGLLHWLRGANMDVLLGTVTATLLSVMAWAIWARRKSNE